MSKTPTPQWTLSERISQKKFAIAFYRDCRDPEATLHTKLELDIKKAEEKMTELLERKEQIQRIIENDFIIEDAVKEMEELEFKRAENEKVGYSLTRKKLKSIIKKREKLQAKLKEMENDDATTS